MKGLIARFAAMPRAARWLILGGVGIGAYFALVEPVLDATAKLNAACASRLARLETAARDHPTDSSVESDVKLGVQRYGLVSMPGAPKDRSEALNRRIAQVLMAHSVRDVTTTVKETPLSGNALARELSAGGSGGAASAESGSDIRVDRLVTELQFEASPETVAAVVADLEKSPEIATVSRLQVRKAVASGGGGGGNGSKGSSSRLVKAVIAAEAWQTVRKGRSR